MCAGSTNRQTNNVTDTPLPVPNAPPTEPEPTLTGLPIGDPARVPIAKKLLARVLEIGDTDSTLALMRALDEDTALDEALNPEWDEALHTQPDAVYRLVRLRLTAGADERWRFRLRQAALAALQIAITDGDTETILNWLTLLSREPAAYGLGDVLHHGILSAQTRVSEDERLARGLVLLALKRDAESLDQLLTDPTILAVLPADLLRALTKGEGDALVLLSAYSSDVFLATLGRAAEQRWGTLFTPPVIDQVWHFYTGGAGGGLPPRFQPTRIADSWSNDGVAWLSSAGFDRLFMLALRDGRDELALALARQLAGAPNMLIRMENGFKQSARSPGDIVMLLNSWLTGSVLGQGEVSSLLERLAQDLAWGKEASPFAQQWARLTQQNPTLVQDAESLWQILGFAATHHDELSLRSVVRQLFARLEAEEGEILFAAGLLRLVRGVSWHATTLDQIYQWWRSYALRQQTTWLGKVERTLAGERELETAHEIAVTVLAMRRLIGKRTLKQLADEVRLTVTALESWMGAFDSDGKRMLTFDPETIQSELETHQGDLTEQERHILSRDLKEMAHLIGVLGDHRTKGSLMRREDEVDRQLMQGEGEPHGAVDMLKWMSGYLGGLQGDKDVEV